MNNYSKQLLHLFFVALESFDGLTMKTSFDSILIRS